MRIHPKGCVKEGKHMMEPYIHIVLITLRCVDIILHTGGIYLLVSSNRRDKDSVQQLFITNLSVAEIGFSVLWLFMIPVSELFIISDSASAIIKDVQHYVMICIYTMVAFVFYATMIFITLDRLVAIKFTLKYRIYWNGKRTKYLITGTWIVGGLLFLFVSASYKFTGFDFNIPFHMYLYTPLNFLFIVLAIFTYIFIFRQYRKSVNMTVRKSRRNTVFVVFCKSRFYLPVLLILTFLLFITIPQLTYLFLSTVQNKRSDILLSACVISYSISNIIDGCLYIFLQPVIKRQLLETLHIRRKGSRRLKNDVEAGQTPRRKVAIIGGGIVVGGGGIVVGDVSEHCAFGHNVNITLTSIQ